MALVLHITIALLFHYLRSKVIKARFEKLMGNPVNAGDWLWVYLKGLVLLVILPFITAECVLMAILDKEAWNYNRTLVLLPHFLNLVTDKRINLLLRNAFRSFRN